MRSRSSLVAAMHRTMASPPVAATWHWLRPGLRILTYHDVPRPEALAAQLDVLAERILADGEPLEPFVRRAFDKCMAAAAN